MIPKQYRIHVVLMITVLLIIVYPMLTQIPDEGKEKLATAAADKFFALIDAGKYAEGWESSSPLLKDKISEESWVKNFTSAMDQLGPVVSREKDKAVYSPTAKDSPDGDYIMLTYDSTYEHRKDVTETVITVFDKDGHWRVAGHFFK